jgi:hypothetical protein
VALDIGRGVDGVAGSEREEPQETGIKIPAVGPDEKLMARRKQRNRTASLRKQRKTPTRIVQETRIRSGGLRRSLSWFFRKLVFDEKAWRGTLPSAECNQPARKTRAPQSRDGDIYEYR